MLLSELSCVLLRAVICRELSFATWEVLKTDTNVVESACMSAVPKLAMAAVESACIACVVKLFKLLPIFNDQTPAKLLLKLSRVALYFFNLYNNYLKHQS